MATVICHIGRVDRGAKVREVRLIGLHGEEAWQAPPLVGDTDPVDGARDDARAASDWVASMLAEFSGGGRGSGIDRICIDTDGAVCAWTPSSGDPALVRAEAERQIDAEPVEGDALDGVDGFDTPPRFPSLQGEMSVEPLAIDYGSGVATATQPAGGVGLFRGAGVSNRGASAKTPPATVDAGRVGVLATPDIPARLIIDELDRQNIACGPVVSLWHVISAVWDPAAAASRSRGPKPARDAVAGGDDVIDMVDPSPACSAVIVFDPATAKALWTWSRDGVVLAAGSMRSGDSKRSSPGASLGGRVVAEWLSWSAQIGVAPDKIVCVAPAGGLNANAKPEAAAGAATDGGSAIEALSDAADAPLPPQNGVSLFAAAVSRGWPGASMDVVADDDPISLSLRRYAERVDAGRDPLAGGARSTGAEMTSLSDRPGRAHRWMYRWIAAALFAAALAVAVVGWRIRASANDLKAEASGVRGQQRELLEEIDPALDWRFPSRELERLRDSVKTATSGEPPFDPPKQIMQGLESLSFVIGTPEFELESASMTESFIQLILRTDTLESYEDLREAFASVADLSATIQSQDVQEQSDGRLRATFTFIWDGGPRQ